MRTKLPLLPLLLLSLMALPTFARQRFFGYCEQGGQPVSTLSATSTTTVQRSYKGCTVSVYLPGTTTIVSIYSDNSGTPKANPFTASLSDGYWFFYADDGTYDVNLSGGGISTPFTLGSVSGQDPFYRGPSSLVPRTNSSKLADVLSVKDYGAVGDGVTDDTTAIQNAMNAACISLAAVYFPRATYAFTNTLVPTCSLTLRGDGPLASILLQTSPGSNKHGIRTSFSLSITDLAINSNAFGGYLGVAAILRCDNSSPVTCPSSDATGTTYFFERFNSTGWNFGVDISGRFTGDLVEQVTVRNCNITIVGTSDAIAEPVNVRLAKYLTVENNVLTGSGGNDHILYIIAVQKVRIANNRIQNNYVTDSAIKIWTGASGLTYEDWSVVGNTIQNVGQALSVFAINSDLLPSVHFDGNYVTNLTDTYGPDNGGINFVSADTSTIYNVFVTNNYCATATLGCVTVQAGATGTVNYFYAANNTFYNWGTLSPGSYYAIGAAGTGSLKRASVSNNTAIGNSIGAGSMNLVAFAQVQVVNNDESGTTGTTTRRVDLQGPGGTVSLSRQHAPGILINDLQVDSSASPSTSPIYALRRSHGTFTAPAAVQNSDILGSVVGYGHDGGDYETQSAAIKFLVAGSGAITSRKVPGQINFATAPGASTNDITDWMFLMKDGKLGVNISNPSARVHVMPGAANEAGYQVTLANGQTADAFQAWSSGNVSKLFSIGADGGFQAGNGTFTVSASGNVNSPTAPGVFNAAGSRFTSAHVVVDQAAMTAGTVTVTLTGAAVFSNGSSYRCVATDASNANPVKVSQTSGSSITFTGSGSDVVYYHCIGN